ncbi:MAG TPA: hypothetical protein VHM90_11250 [Phycisphaerae bacterium]|nr:hypothetical protein [Phycisphaerae bacterium]
MIYAMALWLALQVMPASGGLLFTDSPRTAGDEYVISGCPKDGTTVRGHDRVEALSNSGCTVWTRTEWEKALQAEPMDVPAIEEETKELVIDCNPPTICDKVTGVCTTTATACAPRKQKYFTCADKSRILLTDEQGGKHCMKFPQRESMDWREK